MIYNTRKSKPITDSDSKSCKNCKFHNKEKISCSHFFWDRCVVRDEEGYVVNYNYHQLNLS